MAFRRRRFNRRRRRRPGSYVNLTRKSRYVRRALKMYSVPKNKQTHFHVRRINTGVETNFSVNTTIAPHLGEYLRAISFKLSDLENYGELTQLYDQYMITKVVLDFQWTLVATGGPTFPDRDGPNASYSPQLNLIRDYTDSGAAISQDFRESGRVIRKRITANNPFRITLTPAVSANLYDSAVSTGYGPKWNTRINMTDANVPHYGVKFQILCPATDIGFIQCTAKYYVSCYQTK